MGNLLGAQMILYWLRRARLIIKSTIDLKEEELSNQIRSLTPMQYAALQQIIFELEREANEAASKSVANHGISASCAGGAEHMRMLLERLAVFREKSPKSGQIGDFVPRT
jgi:hypothetical protein